MNRSEEAGKEVGEGPDLDLELFPCVAQAQSVRRGETRGRYGCGAQAVN